MLSSITGIFFYCFADSQGIVLTPGVRLSARVSTPSAIHCTDEAQTPGCNYELVTKGLPEVLSAGYNGLLKIFNNAADEAERKPVLSPPMPALPESSECRLLGHMYASPVP